MRLAKLSSFVLFALVSACNKSTQDTSGSGSSALSSAAPTPPASAAAKAGPGPLIEHDADHVGGVIARAPNSDSVFMADEDHGLLRYIADTSPLLQPKDTPKPQTAPAAPPPVVVVSSARAKPPGSAKSYAEPKPSAAPPPSATNAPAKLVQGETKVVQETLSMGGAPANLVTLRDGALVTVRDPGKLVRVQKGDNGKLSIKHEVAVAADAERHGCEAKHIGEWVRIDCKGMDSGRVDLLAAEKRVLDHPWAGWVAWGKHAGAILDARWRSSDHSMDHGRYVERRLAGR